MLLQWFKRDVEAAKGRVRSSGATVVETAYEPIEYLAYGEGPPVLWVHGVIGGSDQGPPLSRALIGEGFRIIVVSRFGYLGSPLPRDSSPEAQADTYAALLDKLGIEKVALVGSSAGTSSSLHFALRHPNRCWALVVWSQAVPPYSVPPQFAQVIQRTFVFSDFTFWFLMTYMPSRMMRIMGVPRAVQERLSSSDKELVTGLMRSLLPVSLRLWGIMNDVSVTNPALNTITLDRLTVPALCIHAKDDPWGSHEGAKQMWASVPNTQFIEIENGGHLLSGHVEEMRVRMSEFIRQRA